MEERPFQGRVKGVAMSNGTAEAVPFPLVVTQKKSQRLFEWSSACSAAL